MHLRQLRGWLVRLFGLFHRARTGERGLAQTMRNDRRLLAWIRADEQHGIACVQLDQRTTEPRMQRQPILIGEVGDMRLVVRQ